MLTIPWLYKVLIFYYHYNILLIYNSLNNNNFNFPGKTTPRLYRNNDRMLNQRLLN